MTVVYAMGCFLVAECYARRDSRDRSWRGDMHATVVIVAWPVLVGVMLLMIAFFSLVCVVRR